MVLPISKSYIDIIKAFKKDCDNLIRNFREEDTRDVTTFIEIWHSLKFGLVYEKKFPTRGMQYDFMSDSLQIAKLIMIHEDFTGGMFLMYGLYILQNSSIRCLLNNSMASIRLELDEFNYIVKTLRLKDDDIPRTIKKELTFMFSKLLKKDAFHFVVFGRQYDMEGQRRAQLIHRNLFKFDEENVKNMKPKDWFQKRFLKIVPKELKELENDYLNTKNRLKTVFPCLNLGLDMVDESINSTVLKALTLEDNVAGPSQPGPSQPGPSQPGPSQPGPSQPGPSQPGPSQPDTSIGAKRRAPKKRKMKTKHRLQRKDGEGSDPDDPEGAVNNLPQKPKKRRGARRGGRRFYLRYLMNDTGLNTSSNTEDEKEDEEDVSFVFDRKLQNELNLLNLI